MAGAPRAAAQTALAGAVPALAGLPDFDSVVTLIRTRRDALLLAEVESDLRLVRYSPGRIEFQPAESAATDLAQRLAARLQGWTGVRWVVSVTATGGGATLREVADTARDDSFARAQALPAVQAVLAAFPGARVVAVHPPESEPASATSGEPAFRPEAADGGEDWDPFDDL